MESAVNRQLLTGDRNRNKSNHLRELLRVREHDNCNGNGRHVPGTTLGSVLNIDKKSSSANRTLLDIIREDSSKDNKKTWNYFKDKLRLKRAGAAWTSSVHIPASDVPMERNNSANNNRMMMRRQSTRIPVSDPDPLPGLTDSSQSLSRRSSLLQRNASCIPHNNQEEENAVAEEQPHTAEEGDEEEEEGGMGGTAEGNGEGGPVRMSLMSLLAETDREMGIEGSNSLYMIGDEEDEEEEEEGGDRNGGEYNNCCVCMVRHKGAAFIPCGHTFCRLCSRELWVQRGNCPLCNGYILEILDIF